MKAMWDRENVPDMAAHSVSEWVRTSVVLALLQSQQRYSWEGTDEQWPEHFGHFNHYMGLFLRTLVQLISLQQTKSQVGPYSGKNKQTKPPSGL